MFLLGIVLGLMIGSWACKYRGGWQPGVGGIVGAILGKETLGDERRKRNTKGENK